MSDADRLLAARAAEHFGVFTYMEALEAGLSRREVDYRARTRWERVHEGIFRMPGAVATWPSNLWAACAAATAPVAVSQVAAAGVYGLPGGRTDWVEITCRRWKRTVKAGLIVHESSRLDERDIRDYEGLRVVSPERLILELAGARPYVDYVEAVIQAARRKRLITYESTLDTFNRLARRGLRGVAVMRAALEVWDPASRPTDSDMETWLIQVLREHGLPEPLTQFVVRDENGAFVARTDAALPQWRITIEYDSKQEHSDEFQLAKDSRRRNAIAAAGYWPLTARGVDLRDGGQVLVGEIRRIARRAVS